MKKADKQVQCSLVQLPPLDFLNAGGDTTVQHESEPLEEQPPASPVDIITEDDKGQDSDFAPISDNST